MQAPGHVFDSHKLLIHALPFRVGRAGRREKRSGFSAPLAGQLHSNFHRLLLTALARRHRDHTGPASRLQRARESKPILTRLGLRDHHCARPGGLAARVQGVVMDSRPRATRTRIATRIAPGLAARPGCRAWSWTADRERLRRARLRRGSAAVALRPTRRGSGAGLSESGARARTAKPRKPRGLGAWTSLAQHVCVALANGRKKHLPARCSCRLHSQVSSVSRPLRVERPGPGWPAHARGPDRRASHLTRTCSNVACGE